MRKNIKEQDSNVVPMSDKDKLLKAKTFGCFPDWLENGQIGDYGGKKVYYGTNSKKETVVFFPDMTAKNLNTDKTASWKCPQLEETVGTSPEISSYTPDQQNYINSIVSSEGVKTEKPSDYDIEKGKWEIIDLNTKNPNLFPEKGKNFVYKQKGEVNVTTPQQDNVISGLTGIGFLRTEPDVTKSDLYIKVNLQTIENGKYKVYFNQPFYMYQPISSVKVDDLLATVKTGFNEQKVDIKQCRESIDVLYTAYVKKYKLDDQSRMQLKNYVQRCSQQIPRIFGAQKKLDVLLNLPASDPTKLSLRLKNENTLNLKSLIRENLMEVSEKKKRLLKEERIIIDTRFNLISENVDIKTKKGKDKFVNDLIGEMVYLNRQDYNQELISEGFFDMISGLFGQAPKGILEYIKQKFINWLMDTVAPGSSKTWVGGIISNALSNTPIGELPKLFECSYLSKALAKAIGEEFTKQMIQYKVGAEGPFYEILRNSLVNAIDESDFVQKLEGSIANLICSKLGNIKDKMDTLSSTMRQKALSPA